MAAAAAGRAAAAPEEKRLIIDTHLEVWTFNPKFPFNHPEKGQDLDVKIEAPIENQVEQMRDFGIHYAVLINPRYFGWDNSYIADCQRRFPKLFVAHGLLHPEDPQIVDRLRYWVEEHGFQGMRFSPIYHRKSTWLNSREHYPLWKEAEKLGVVFNYYIAPQQMPMLEEMAGRFPGVKIVVDHGGMPELASPDCWKDFRLMFGLKRFPQVWISSSEPYDISLTRRYPFEDTLPFYRAIYEEFGGEQIIWGTGYPRPRWELPMDQELEFVDKHCNFYTAADRELILGKNALRIWKFPEAS